MLTSRSVDYVLWIRDILHALRPGTAEVVGVDVYVDIAQEDQC